jgi:uncharacterized protein (DUF58 family)
VIVGRDTSVPTTLDELLPAPLLDRLERVDLVSRRYLSGKMQGERRSKRRGRSVEFDDHRPYAPGDDVRHVNWGLYARLDRFFVKLFLEEEDLGVMMLVDLSASMFAGSPSKAAFAARAAMALGSVALVHRSRLHVACFGHRAHPAILTPMRGRASLPRLGRFLLEQLDDARRLAGGHTSLENAVRDVQRAWPGRGLVLLLSDLIEPGGAAGVAMGLRRLSRLAGTGPGPAGAVVRVLSPGERDPQLEADLGLVGDLRLTDAETGAAREVTITPAMVRRYRERFAEREQGIARACSAAGLARVDADPGDDVGALVLEQLRRRTIVA